MKFAEPRPFANPDVGARKIVELANEVETVQDGPSRAPVHLWSLRQARRRRAAELQLEGKAGRDDGLSIVPWSVRWRSNPALVEGHADPLLLAPDDVTGNVRIVRLKDKVEALGDVVGACNLDRRARNGNIADQAVNGDASELNRPRHQYSLARTRASFHETVIRRNL